MFLIVEFFVLPQDSSLYLRCDCFFEKGVPEKQASCTPPVARPPSVGSGPAFPPLHSFDGSCRLVRREVFGRMYRQRTTTTTTTKFSIKLFFGLSGGKTGARIFSVLPRRVLFVKTRHVLTNQVQQPLLVLIVLFRYLVFCFLLLRAVFLRITTWITA